MKSFFLQAQASFTGPRFFPSTRPVNRSRRLRLSQIRALRRADGKCGYPFSLANMRGGLLEVRESVLLGPPPSIMRLDFKFQVAGMIRLRTPRILPRLSSNSLTFPLIPPSPQYLVSFLVFVGNSFSLMKCVSPLLNCFFFQTSSTFRLSCYLGVLQLLWSLVLIWEFISIRDHFPLFHS